MRASLKEEITSEIKNLHVESPKQMLKLLKPGARGNIKENTEEKTEISTLLQNQLEQVLPKTMTRT